MTQCVTKLSSTSMPIVFLAGGLCAYKQFQTLGVQGIEANQVWVITLKKKKKNTTSAVSREISQDESFVETGSALEVYFSSSFFCFDQKGELCWIIFLTHIYSYDVWIWQDYLARNLQCTWILPEHLFYADFSGDKNSFREIIWLSILIFIKHVGYLILKPSGVFLFRAGLCFTKQCTWRMTQWRMFKSIALGVREKCWFPSVGRNVSNGLYIRTSDKIYF